MNKFQPKLFIVAFIFFAFARIAPAQTATFTYQGRLTDASAQANGTYDLGFALFDAATGGTQIGAAQTRAAVNVSNGVFTVQLDFGAAAFPGANRFLEIAVKRPSDVNFTTLTPRQPITSTPYAIRALNATSADTATTAATAATATNAQQLGGAAAASYLQTNGSGANLTNLNAVSVSTGTLADARLSSNVALRNSANAFTGNQTITGDLSQTGATTDLNVSNGFVARGTSGAGAIPATGAGARMMFYPGKAAFRAGRLFNDTTNNIDGSAYWDDNNVGANSAAFNSNNRASGVNSSAFGSNAVASGERAFTVNGTASAPGAIAIGSGAQATNDDSLALGPASIASGFVSVAIGPSRASGGFAVAIGLQNSASGQFSVAIGKNADTSNRQGSIVIGDGCANFSSDKVTASANNQVNIRGCGGFRFFTGQATPENGNTGAISGVSLAPGGSQWLSLSDRASKENFRAVDSRDILRKVLNLPISTWNYKSQAASIRHIGAMAQDFKAAFAVGEDDRHISALDPDGVALAAIQGLNEEMSEQTARLRAENAQLRQQVAAQSAQFAALEARLKKLERTASVGRKAERRK